MKMTGPSMIMSKVIEETLSPKKESEEKIGYIRPSSLAKGCVLYVAMELLKMPKEDIDNRIKRILEAGTSGHFRIAKYFSKITVAKELPFIDEEYRIKGQCDALIYIPSDLDVENSGFYVVEIKTTSSSEFDKIKEAGRPKEEHVTQCFIYIWGLTRHYKSIPIRGGIIYYENRDTLNYHLFNVTYDENLLRPLLSEVKAMLPGLIIEGKLPEAHLPLDHWGHEYCSYLSTCAIGQEAMKRKKENKPQIPDRVLAEIIGMRIVKKKKAREEKTKSKKPRSLAELSREFKWE
jgi:hypothetical protein